MIDEHYDCYSTGAATATIIPRDGHTCEEWRIEVIAHVVVPNEAREPFGPAGIADTERGAQGRSTGCPDRGYSGSDEFGCPVHSE